MCLKPLNLNDKMKKIIILFIIASLMTNVLKSQEAFHKGVIVIDLGVGVNVYKTSTIDQYNSQVWNGGNLSTIRIKKDTTGNAGSAIYPLTIEYGLKIGLGLP